MKILLVGGNSHGKTVEISNFIVKALGRFQVDMEPDETIATFDPSMSSVPTEPFYVELETYEVCVARKCRGYWYGEAEYYYAKEIGLSYEEGFELWKKM